ncbi:hypothetical protein QQS21_006412 [Conoideocrella luteorostrata]|uniref:Uncharacterized protein n=1 Tax=Conoideocrella luteorostrata TaxID=1105319 RepID=A0AAJ0CQJ2_9HYPO|nr:hypothetical protein QQS21_006412 [Conoideocrella luteorostrata]
MSSRYSLISSLYGPGAVGCWLFTVGSVLISWTLNPTSRVKDSIDNDCIAALSLPVVAASHLIFQVRQFPGDKSTITTTSDEALLQHSASIEAALNVCETFADMTLPLFLLCAFRHHFKRAILIAAVGLVSFAGEAFLSFQSSSTVSPGSSNLSRPYLMNISGVIVAITATLAHVLIFYLLCFSAYVMYMLPMRTAERERVGSDGQRGMKRLGVRKVFWNANILTTLPLLFMAGSLSMGLPLGLLGQTALMGSAGSGISRLKLFLPASDIAVLELDQIVPLMGGAITFLFSLYDALKGTLRVLGADSQPGGGSVEMMEFEGADTRHHSDINHEHGIDAVISNESRPSAS